MIERRTHRDVTVLTLENGRANALTVDLLHALRDALDREADDPARGLVLTGAGSMFCAGLDLLALENADHDDVLTLGTALSETVETLFRHPRPTVAAINGHAIAGGALLALACDRRFVAAGAARFGLTEAQLGLIVPPSIVEMLRHPLPRPALEHLLYSGATIEADEAVRRGVVEATVEAEALIEHAAAAVAEWSPNVHAFADVKRRLHAPVLASMRTARADDVAFVDRWFADDAQAALGEQIQRLRSR